MSKSKQYIVIEADAAEIRVSRAMRGDGPIGIHERAAFPALSDASGCALLDQNACDEVVSHVARAGWAGSDAIVIVSGENAALCQLPMPSLRGQALQNAVRLKLSQQLHFSLDEAVLRIQTSDNAPEANGGRFVTAAVLQRPTALAAVELAQRAGLRLSACTLASAAVARLISHRGTPRADGLHAYLSMGERSSFFAVYSGSGAVLTTELPLGRREFDAALIRPIIADERVIQLEPGQAKIICERYGIPEPEEQIIEAGVPGQRFYPLLEPVLQRLVQLITQWLAFVSTQCQASGIQSLQLIGGAGRPSKAGRRVLSERMRLQISRCELEAKLANAAGRQTGARDSVLAVGSAVRFASEVPDLVPPDIRRKWSLQNARRSTAIVGQIAAVAIFGIAALFDHLGVKVESVHAGDLGELSALREFIELNESAASVQLEIRELERRLDAFRIHSPNWEGAFRELSRRLPPQLVVTALRTSDRAGPLRLILEARVEPAPASDFNAVVETTLRSLEESPFFESVQLLASSRNVDSSPRNTHMERSVELLLAYRRPAVEEETPR